MQWRWIRRVWLLAGSLSVATSFLLSHQLQPSPPRSVTSWRSRLFASLEDETSSSSDEEDVAELIRQIRGPLGQQQESPGPRTILILSDTTGVTARSAVSKSIQQFNGCDERFYVKLDDADESDSSSDHEDCINLSTRVYPFLQSEEEVASKLKQVTHAQNTMVVFTFASTALRDATIRMCDLSGMVYVDLLGSMFDTMAQFFHREPLGAAGDVIHRLDPRQRRRQGLSDDYYRRIEAVEYTLKCDDGMKPRLWKEADVVLIGVSRTGKTPLSVVLAQTMGLKVANVPLVVELPAPPLLFDLDPQRLFCLTLNPSDLQRIRRFRLRRELEHATNDRYSSYADLDYLEQDLEHAREVARELKCVEIDVTGRAVEETASYIQSLLNERFPDSHPKLHLY